MPSDRRYYVYILTSPSGTLYIGVTNAIEVRTKAHKEARGSWFTTTCGCNRLVHYERWGRVVDAIARETQLKKWSRKKKIALIESVNPKWCDLSEHWGEPWDFSASFGSASLRSK